MSKDIGFNGKERAELNATIEDILKNLVDKKKDPYGIYRGEFVEVTGHGFGIIGIYRGIRNFDGFSEAVLCPTFLQKGVDAPTEENLNRRVTYFEIVNKPSFVNLHGICLVMPYDREYIESRAESTQRIAGIKRVIIDS